MSETHPCTVDQAKRKKDFFASNTTQHIVLDAIHAAPTAATSHRMEKETYLIN
jgi:hypothetical protein